jgi:tight adherence protein B
MTAAVVLVWLAAGASPAAAAGPEGELSRSKVVDGRLTLLFSASQSGKPVTIDPNSVEVTLTPSHGSAQEVKPAVSAVTASATRVDRGAMLVLDTSGSMSQEGRLEAAKSAALTFLHEAPADVKVGLMTFGDPPTLRSALGTPRPTIEKQIDRLKADGNTALFEAVSKAADQLKTLPSGTIILLSDGRDDDRTGQSPSDAAVRAKLESLRMRITGVTVGEPDAKDDVVKLTGANNLITAEGGRGQLVDRVTQVFQDQSEALDKQLQISVPLPGGAAAAAGMVEVSGYAGGAKISLTTVYTGGAPKPAPTAVAAPKVATPDPRLTAVTTPVAIVAIAGLFGALCILIATATGALVRNPDEESEVVRRLSVYTFSGREARRTVVAEQTTALGSSAVARGAVELADRLARGRQLETSLDSRLDAAGLPLRTAEWTVVHVGVALGGALLFLLVGGGTIVAGALGLLLGLIAPWLFLALRQSRRESKFLSQLPDTLQLLAGSLQAGYSLPQAMDTVVREARAPIGTEFNRALIEARLGVPPEEALEGIARRTRSRDFRWIVMAIKIQKDVGGNLAELLGNVAETLRERERLRRQVSALSAEGRLSGIILAGLPVVFTIYLTLVRPDYLEPMVTTRMGLTMLAMGAILLVVGGVWMSRVVKVQV